MYTRGNRLGFTLWNVCILALFAAGCTSNEFSREVKRQPVPTLSGPAKNYTEYSNAIKKGVVRVQRGDSLYVLARRYGVALRGLIQANRLKAPYVIYPGQRLKLPVSRTHIVVKGQTVYQISRHYDVDMGALVRINNIDPPYRVGEGQRLRLPEASLSKISVANKASPSQQAVIGRRKPRLVVARSKRIIREKPPVPPARSRWNKGNNARIKAPPARKGRKFLWPLRGRVIVSFGARAGGLHNDGINIAARKGASIRAAENGVVAYTGNQLQGFGNLVLLKHAGGWMSAYAHSSKILVKRGDVVRRGQVIARVGRTGNVTKPQLHFELRRGERAVNPKYHLVRVAHWMPVPRQYALIPDLKTHK
jgi:murein DD-endopeptidase MepM/ murein hydrolase activator NlpD